MQPKRCISKRIRTCIWIYDSALRELESHMDQFADRFAIWFLIYLGADFAWLPFDFVMIRSRYSDRYLDT